MTLEAGRTVAVLGATGNVGRLVVRRLLANPAVERVVTINRRAMDPAVLPPGNERLEHIEVPMHDGAALRTACEPLLAGVDVVVATMGLGSGRGAPELWRRVEVELPTAFAQAAAAAGVPRAVLLTAVGADIEKRRSWLTLHIARGRYFHIKGTVEANFLAAGFSHGVTIFRPAGLLGTDHLPAFVDRLFVMFDWLAPVRWRCVHITQLAAAIADAAVEPPGSVVIQGQELFDLLPGERTTSFVSELTAD